jgi:hypothetical protein
MNGLLKMLKPALALVSSPSRDRLKSAISARDAARTEVETAKRAVERFESVIDQGRDAASRASDADAAAKRALAAWAQSGLDPQAVAEHEGLASAADAAKRVADRAQVAADAARKGLGQAQRAVERAQSDLAGCEDRIRCSIDLIFVDEFAPTLERLEQLAADYQACRIQARGLFDYVGSSEASGIIRASYQRAGAAVKPIPDYEVNHMGSQISAPPVEILRLTKAWRERAAQLRENPDA